MDLSQFMTALRARRKAFLLVLMATIFTAVAVALVVPKKYVATATLMMDARDEQTMSPSRMSPRERAGYVSTQVDLLMSGRVAAQVARDLKLAQRPGVREEYEAETGGAIPIEDWIAAGLLERLKVDTSASNVMTVSVSSSDPRFATEVANAFAKAYLGTALALRTGPTREAAEWFEEQLKGFRVQVTQAQSKLASFQKAKGITFADERTDVESVRLAELSSQLLAAKNATYDAQTRYRQAREMLASGAAADELPEILSNTYLNTLKTELNRAEARMETETTVLGQNHPAFVRTISEVQGLRDKFAAEAKKVIAGLGTQVEQSRKREEELRAAMEAQTQRIHALRDYRAELAVMSRDVENAQRAYDAVLARFVTNKIDSRATQTNVAMLTPAVEPLKPAHPKVGLITALAVLVGALLAAGVVWVLETLDRRVRSRADLDSRLAVPSLGYLSRWQPAGGRLLPAPMRSTARALPHPW
jgi:chain length determinant protein EpsF